MRRRPRVWRLSAFLPLALSCQMLLAADGRWSPAGPPGNVSALTIDAEGRVYAVTAEGMWRSEDHAETWSLVDPRLNSGVVRAIAGDPTEPGSVMAVGCGAYQSVDGGETWRARPEFSSDCVFETLQVDPSRPQGFFASGAAGLYRTGFAAAGQTWLPLGARFFERTTAAAEPFSGGRIFGAPASGGVFATRDSGATWTRLAADPPAGPIRQLQYSGGVVAATDGGTFATFDGTSWQDTSGALSGSRVFSLLAPAAVGVRGKNRVAYASTSTGIYRANTFATGWRRFSDGLPEGGVRDIVATTDGRLAYALSEHGEGIFAYRYPFLSLSFEPGFAVLSSTRTSSLRIRLDPPQPIAFEIQVEAGDLTTARSRTVEVEPLASEVDIPVVPSKAGATTLTLSVPPEVGDAALEIPIRIENPRPVIGRLFPARASAGAAAFTLLVFDYFNPGTFASDAVVFWNGSPRPTRLVLPGACPGFCPAAVLVADITAEDLASPGTVVVTVVNPAPGGGAADPFEFHIDPAAPRAVIPPCRDCSFRSREVAPRPATR